MDLKKLCFELADIPGTSGDESVLSDCLVGYLSDYMTCKVDKLGNVIGTVGDGSVHILLDAHIDQVGLVVRGIDEKGFLLIDKVGSVDPRVLTGAEVTVHGKEKIFGVVCSVPPHLRSDDKDDKINIKTMAIDVGMDKEKVSELVNIGDRITIRNNQSELLNNCISSCAFDNRCSVAAIIGALDLVKDKLKNIKLSVLFSVQEEVGCRGAAPGSFSLEPDYCIVVDVGFGVDPYTDKSLTIELGKGPSIGIAPILDRAMTQELVRIADEKGICYQHDVMNSRTGTNADSITISGKGVRTSLISIPLRYMHTANEVICFDDIEKTARLIAEYLIEKENETDA